ncbi:MAG: hypothetical protein LPK19_07740, partial [Hymenobacteraceae bacterium]|nr:hypothetical protein [Hymenobacteraceae bacterium]MDX5396100.1 hypothetical protein [Hymenobacteraceae bacterium]MDX5512165.1 hypothetical protein [Hymenobacteraceae bacterium]
MLVAGFCLSFNSGSAQQPGGAAKAKALVKQASKALKNQHTATAIALYEQALQQDSSLTKVHYNLANLYTAQHQPSNAAAHYRYVARTASKKYPDATLKLAEAFQQTHRFEEAHKLYTTVLSETKLKHWEKREMLEKKLAECVSGIELLKTPAAVTVNNAGKELNTKNTENGPFFVKQGQNLLFQSTEVTAAPVKKKKNAPLPSTISAAKTLNEYKAPAKVKALAGKGVVVSASADGSELYLYNEVNGGDLYVTKKTGPDTWSEPVALPEPINSKYKETAVYFSADGDYVFFSSDRPEGLGGLDLYISMRQPDGTWSEAMNLGGHVNSFYDEDRPFIDPELNVLYFSSKGHNSMGGYDIFRSAITDVVWAKAENCGYPINTAQDDMAFTMLPGGKSGLFASNREGGQGSFDLYQVT